ncbi:hypothetical protein [Bacteroides fragilis]|uniref:hypothetical protein n=1 Tax=Bacteroides fragilis TaxID=817 RepID=UPI00202FA9F5|nr:hypothetical protein [Bacteroides fragilis]MCM0315724.1 hypothetical protein [Bacteroides fragilis]
MIFIFRQIYRIVEDRTKSFLYDIDGNIRSKFQVYLGFVFVLIVIYIIAIWKEISLEDIIDTLLIVLSVFTTLILGVLFTALGKLSQRIERFKDKTDDITENYLVRFSDFARSFVWSIIFIIVISVVLIILLVFLKIITDNIIKLILTTMSLVLFYDLIMYILVILSNIYTLLMDGVDVCEKDLF